MPIAAGKHELGPEAGTIRVETKRQGAAAKAGHDLVLELGSWRGTLEAGQDGAPLTLELSADPASLHVIEGTGGVMALTEDDKVEIKRTIEDEVLGSQPIRFQSTKVEPFDDRLRLRVSGELTMNGNTHPLDFALKIGPDGRVSGQATVIQSDWGIEPYSGLFGALKVRDEVEVIAEASVPAQAATR